MVVNAINFLSRLTRKMKTRKERYAGNRKLRRKLGIIRKRCKACGCFILNRHKEWCPELKLLRLMNTRD